MAILGFNFWIFLGVLFLILEVITNTFYAFFIGVAAIIVGILKWLGLINNLQIEVILFIFSSLAGILLFRQKLRDFYMGKKEKD
jgi:inner membrane protein